MPTRRLASFLMVALFLVAVRARGSEPPDVPPDEAVRSAAVAVVARVTGARITGSSTNSVRCEARLRVLRCIKGEGCREKEELLLTYFYSSPDEAVSTLALAVGEDVFFTVRAPIRRGVLTFSQKLGLAADNAYVVAADFAALPPTADVPLRNIWWDKRRFLYTLPQGR